MHQLGHTRSTRQPTHLLHTPDAFVRIPLPGLTDGLAIIHASPQLGAAFLQYTAELAPAGTLAPTPHQRLLFLLEGEATLTLPPESQAPASTYPLRPGSYAYLPPHAPATLTASTSTRLVLIEKPYHPLPGAPPPTLLVAHEDDLTPQPLDGDEALQVRVFLPSHPAFDFAVNTMTYASGASLSQVEVHVMEHGLLMLQGGGIYRLADAWYPVQTGDFVWMAPFCPQWFCAVGKEPAKYLIYKDFQRTPSL